MKKSFLLMISLCALLITACAHKRSELTIPTNLSPQKRADFLLNLPYWKLKGRIGIITDEGSETASFEWTTHKKTITLRIYGGLGTTYALLESSPGKSKIELPDERVFYGDDPQQLLWEATGWDIPVNQLQTWILGISKKNNKRILYPSGYLQQIEHSPWIIQFKTYDYFDELKMPKKLQAKSDGITLKFSIRSWSFSPE